MSVRVCVCASVCVRARVHVCKVDGCGYVCVVGGACVCACV